MSFSTCRDTSILDDFLGTLDGNAFVRHGDIQPGALGGPCATTLLCQYIAASVAPCHLAFFHSVAVI